MDLKRCKPMTEDCLLLILQLTTIAFEYKILKAYRLFAVAFVAALLLINIGFFFAVSTMAFCFKYMPVFLVLLAATLFNLVVLLSERSMKNLQREFFQQLLSIDSATNAIKEQILKESKYAKIYIVINSVLSVVTGFVLIPHGIEADFHFSLYFFRTYLPSCSKFLEIIYFITFPVISYSVVYLAHVMVYFIQHSRFLMHICIHYLRHMVDDYDGIDDDVLIYSHEYQENVKKRLRSIINQFMIMRKLSFKASDTVAEMIPTFSIGGFLMGISVAFYIYNGTYFGKYLYLQDCFWFSQTLLTCILFLKYGQDFETETGNLSFECYYGRWITFNQSNKRMILLLLTNSEPLKLQFTQNISVNYKLALKIIRSIYSFTAIIARIRYN